MKPQRRSRGRSDTHAKTLEPRDRNARAAWIGLLFFLGVCLLGGGSNLPTVAPLIVLRPVAILLIAGLLILPSRGDGAMRTPMLLLAFLTATIAIQLVPLPPRLWSSLPGHAPFADFLADIGQGGVWRPLSLTPGITLASFLATLTGWAIILAFTRLPPERRQALSTVVVVMALVSCLVGLLQVIGGSTSMFYFYSSDGSISGLLGNRNHQAALLAATLPLVRVWMVEGRPEAQVRRTIVASLVGVLLLGMILLTGSRSGLALALIGTTAAYTIAPLKFPRRKKDGRRGAGDRRRDLAAVARWGALLLPLVLVGAAIATGRDLSIQRLTGDDLDTEIRLRALPTTLALVKTYFPFGSGFGSFDAVFRMHEPDSLLRPTFFNRAHNDYLELAITGGVLPVIALIVFFIWAGAMTWASLRRSWREPGVLHARAGAAILVIFAAASLSDYTLRPPLMSAVAVIAVCWLAYGRERPARETAST